MADEQNVYASNWKECVSLYGQHACKKHTGGQPLERPPRDLRHPSVVQHETESEQVCVRVNGRKIPGIHGIPKGIEVNSEKIQAIMELAPLKMVKEVQSLNGKVAALNRFVSRAMDKCLPFFHTLKKSFEWSKLGEELFLYLAVSVAAISVALVSKEDGVQKPIYFTSRAL